MYRSLVDSVSGQTLFDGGLETVTLTVEAGSLGIDVSSRPHEEYQVQFDGYTKKTEQEEATVADDEEGNWRTTDLYSSRMSTGGKQGRGELHEGMVLTRLNGIDQRDVPYMELLRKLQLRPLTLRFAVRDEVIIVDEEEVEEEDESEEQGAEDLNAVESEDEDDEDDVLEESNKIFMWRHCKRCQCAVTPVVQMSQRTWQFSYGKFLEIMFHGGSGRGTVGEKRPGTTTAAAGESGEEEEDVDALPPTFGREAFGGPAYACPHHVRKDHIQCFACPSPHGNNKPLIASFEYIVEQPYGLASSKVGTFTPELYEHTRNDEYAKLRLLAKSAHSCFLAKLEALEVKASTYRALSDARGRRESTTSTWSRSASVARTESVSSSASSSSQASYAPSQPLTRTGKSHTQNLEQSDLKIVRHTLTRLRADIQNTLGPIIVPRGGIQIYASSAFDPDMAAQLDDAAGAQAQASATAEGMPSPLGAARRVSCARSTSSGSPALPEPANPQLTHYPNALRRQLYFKQFDWDEKLKDALNILNGIAQTLDVAARGAGLESVSEGATRVMADERTLTQTS
jgi:hypothetical protein